MTCNDNNGLPSVQDITAMLEQLEPVMAKAQPEQRVQVTMDYRDAAIVIYALRVCLVLIDLRGALMDAAASINRLVPGGSVQKEASK